MLMTHGSISQPVTSSILLQMRTERWRMELDLRLYSSTSVELELVAMFNFSICVFGMESEKNKNGRVKNERVKNGRVKTNGQSRTSATTIFLRAHFLYERCTRSKDPFRDFRTIANSRWHRSRFAIGNFNPSNRIWNRNSHAIGRRPR